MLTIQSKRFTAGQAKRTVVLFAEAKGKLTKPAAAVNTLLGKAVSKSFKGTRFTGGAGEFSRLTVNAKGITQVLTAGLGKTATMDRAAWWKVGLSLGKQLDAMGVKEATLALADIESKTDALAIAQAVIEGLHMSTYRFEEFKTELKPHQKAKLAKITILTDGSTARKVKSGMPALKALLEGTDLTRYVANMPPNIANPEFMAEQARKLEKLGVKVTVFDEKQLAKMGCNLILAVGGSAAAKDQPRLVIMEYNGAGKGAPKTAIVGKGIMFDTGGYNVKPGNSMRGMKYDMSGAAAVLGTMKALAERKAKVNVVGTMTCAMNMIGTEPFVMDSIYKSYKGLMVEIGHTDAEGRLVLADAIAYTIDKHEPKQLVDLATLTGACMVALAGAYAGLFSTSSSLTRNLKKAGDEVGEKLWHLPVDDCFTSKSDIADICNDSAGGWGGASVGAAFLKKFADKTPWAHLDIAGVANADKIAGSNPYLSGSTAFGVRLLTNWLENHLTAGEEEETASDKPKAKRGRGRPRKAA